MWRRRFLALLAAGTAGCQTRQDGVASGTESASGTETTSPSRPESESKAPSSGNTENATATEPDTDDSGCPTATARLLSVGRAVTAFDWRFAVVSITLTRTYRLDGESRTRTLPSGEQFVIVEIAATNRGTESNEWFFDEGFRLFTPTCSTPRWRRFVSLDGERVPVSDLQRVDHLKQFRTEIGYPFDPGEDGRMWYVTLVDASLDPADVSVVLEFDIDGFPVRWVPLRGTTSTHTDSPDPWGN